LRRNTGIDVGSFPMISNLKRQNLQEMDRGDDELKRHNLY
jgi:hypothetical protein